PGTAGRCGAAATSRPPRRPGRWSLARTLRYAVTHEHGDGRPGSLRRPPAARPPAAGGEHQPAEPAVRPAPAEPVRDPGRRGGPEAVHGAADRGGAGRLGGRVRPRRGGGGGVGWRGVRSCRWSATSTADAGATL